MPQKGLAFVINEVPGKALPCKLCVTRWYRSNSRKF